MSLYTPVFPSFHGSNASRKDPPSNTLTTVVGKQQNYVEFLRDIHLFLSTQSEMLSPPSRPTSPMFDHHVQKVKDEIQKVFDVTEGETSSGKWTRISQALKLGCVRGRCWSVSGAGSSTLKEDTNWILPDEEAEWIEWEKKREENRRLKGKTNVSQQIDTGAFVASSSQKTNYANFPELAQFRDVVHKQAPLGISPSTMRAVKEKVRKWQASVASEAWHETTNDFSLTSSRVTGAAAVAKAKFERPQRSRTIDFAVVKPTAKLIIGKKGGGSLSRLGVRGSAPTHLAKSKSSTSSKVINIQDIDAPPGVDKIRLKQPPMASSTKNVAPKIADIPETPYLPPSFPAHLETSTPLPDSAMIIRAKPSPILPIPAASSMPLPSTSADLFERQVIVSEPTLPPGKRSRALSMPFDGTPNDSSVNSPAKKIRASSQNRSTPPSKHPQPMSSNRDVDVLPCTRDDTRDPNLDSAPSRYNMDSLGMMSAAPSTPGKKDRLLMGADAQGFPEKIPSPAKSAKSFFSAPDSESGDSPVKANLLLESPVSPMLSYAQNLSGFLPQITSTQVYKEFPGAAQTNTGMLGMGFSSQFDVERHVDRVSELLEKDVDFDGWLRDVPTVDTSKDQ